MSPLASLDAGQPSCAAPYLAARDVKLPLMPALNFGQPQAGVFQMAYVVEDIEASMRHWIEQLGVGPWFLLESFRGERPTFRDAPSEAEVALAMSFAGHMLVELIALKDDRPSVWREGVERLGYGFHHFGVGTDDYDAEIARHAERGHALAFECAVPTGGRVGYVDTTAELPGYLEVIELDAPTEAAFTQFYATALTWDGAQPIRPFA
jgi:hypothetical protein